jgi:lipid II:glycine glycyltransferase (peptidoglycan interpeptide bridge formation enzyme)
MRSEAQIDAARILISRRQKDPLWDAFVISHPEGQYEQTSAWAQAKLTEGWHPLRVFMLSSGEPRGGVQILYKKISLLGKVAYASKGPILTPNSSSQIIRRL